MIKQNNKELKRNSDKRTVLEWLIAYYDKNGFNNQRDILSFPNSRQICLATGVLIDDVFDILYDLTRLGTATLHDTKPEYAGFEPGDVDTFCFFDLHRPKAARSALERLKTTA